VKFLDKESKENLKQTHRSIRVKREELRITKPQSVRLGVIGIIYSIVAVLLAYPVAWLVVKLFIWAFSGVLMVLVGNLLCIALGLMLPFIYIKSVLIPTILYPINQLILNRRAISWISLFISIAAILVGTAGVFYFIFRIAFY